MRRYWRRDRYGKRPAYRGPRGAVVDNEWGRGWFAYAYVERTVREIGPFRSRWTAMAAAEAATR